MTLDEQLTVDLWILDAALTGRDSREGRGNDCKIVSCDDFYTPSGMFYLSDGGYSRVYYNGLLDKPILCLASESRDEVKARWADMLTIRWRIEHTMKRWQNGDK